MAWTINDPDSETYRREFESLLSIQDHYPKQIITMWADVSWTGLP